MVEGITVVKFGMNDGGGNGRSCFEIEKREELKLKMDTGYAQWKRCRARNRGLSPEGQTADLYGAQNVICAVGIQLKQDLGAP